SADCRRRRSQPVPRCHAKADDGRHMIAEDLIDATERLLKQLTPILSDILSDEDDEVIGYLLAELVAAWIIGYTGDTPEDTEQLRHAMMRLHHKTISLLVEHYSKRKNKPSLQ